MKLINNFKIVWIVLPILFLLPITDAYGMHIMEGFLPPAWSLFWWAVVLPFQVKGFFAIKKIVQQNPKLKLLLAMAGAFVFVLSALKLPSITGSCSHPTGVGLGAMLFGPSVMSVLGSIVLLFQALLLAHGGLTTLGANAFSMAIIGPIASYLIFKLVQKTIGHQGTAVFLGAALGNLLTYVTTSLQLAAAFPAEQGGIYASAIKFMGIFAVTQVPLAVIEGLLTVLIFNTLVSHSREELRELNIISTK